MQLEPLFLIRANLGDTHMIGASGRGTRAIADVTGGSFEGEKLKGQVLTPGADWAVIDDGGFCHLDVRLVLKTDDGAMIYMTYTGFLEFPKDRRSESQFGEHQFVTQPRFECGDERYNWLNRTVAVAEGRLLPSAVEYQVYACHSG